MDRVSYLQYPAIRIDSHQHFWKYNPIRDAWITDQMKVIQRDFLPHDLAPILKENIIDGCVTVQADQSETETQFLLELAAKNDFVKGVVGWVDLRSDELHKRLEFYSDFKKLKGFRHIVQAEPVGFMRGAEFSKGIGALRQYNFTYDILIYPHQIQDAIWLVSHHPDQKFVVDHLAKPNIREKEFNSWSAQMKELASHTNVYCKLSGMVTEANWDTWTNEDFKPYLDFIINHFGINRVMYGSDWPVCLLAASYHKQLNILEEFLRTFSSSEIDKIMGENAIRFYNL
ncbi:MAG TPA: amidohydrolase family protein [Cyclobacteriaceae bacterium]|nr:amidohydrolase family protein [Cyclobacteriaceae bacterium]HPW62780.1 amidohydrolase family protein [Cyclobacteriaceae bacterium]